MVEDFKEIHEKLVKSDAFSSFQEENKGYYLAHGFVQLGSKDGAAKDWQVGLYSPKKDNLAVFDTNPPEFLSFDEAFKEGGIINELKYDPKTFLTTADCLAKAKTVLKEKYKGEITMSTIVILQMINKLPTYNFTFITQAFSMISIHVNALSGEITKEVKNSVLDLKKPE
jgi:hypothetical protein